MEKSILTYMDMEIYYKLLKIQIHSLKLTLPKVRKISIKYKSLRIMNSQNTTYIQYTIQKHLIILIPKSVKFLSQKPLTEL